MQTVQAMFGVRRSVACLAVRAAAAAACAILVCGCNTDQQVTGVPEVPVDYRLRHPITLHEANRTLQVFIGSNRGELNPTQRAQVLAFGLSWKRAATGGMIVEHPVGSSNERAAADGLHEIVSILAASGLPPQSIVVQTYDAATGPSPAPVRISYPRIKAQVGPCGLWPKDIGPSFNRDYFENQPPWNFGCATQNALAVEVANPSDLVQPRAETPPYTMRRATVLQKYTNGQNPSTQESSSANAAKISDVGK
jgi:pilus assembly protein CpaD